MHPNHHASNAPAMTPISNGPPVWPNSQCRALSDTQLRCVSSAPPAAAPTASRKPLATGRQRLRKVLDAGNDKAHIG